MMMRSGAGELAFATLDKTNTWKFRAEYDKLYPSYTKLFLEKPKDVAKVALKTIYNANDSWFFSTFGLFALFLLPGFFRILRVLDWQRLGVIFTLLAVQATYLWSGVFANPRHVLVATPFLMSIAVLGTLIVPRRIPGYRNNPRALVLGVLILAYAVFSAVPLVQHFKAPSTLLEIGMADAAEWMKSNVTAEEKLTCTRLNIAYEGRFYPFDYVDVFGTETVQHDQVKEKLQAKGCRYLAWIRGHSSREFPELAPLGESTEFPGLRRVFNNDWVAIWVNDEEK